MGLTKMYNKMEKSLKNMPIWLNLLVLLALIFILISIYNTMFMLLKKGFISRIKRINLLLKKV